ncbi:plasmid mobilization protein [Burkholderia sp. WAC0059]|uniref:plasmid mobilization protein n=1 Tax=Burkholderia sp. WAC0059 TaxID=2066022 RepID=UPI002154FBB3|nr:hypothetical protein [Burkholderia sp. WAC0059]
MNKPSERIVVFVTPAQKRAIAATADELGISVSELMRRAVLAFSATGDQVKAASIVDRLNAPREPDTLSQVLRKAARPLRQGRRAGAGRPGAAGGAQETTATGSAPEVDAGETTPDVSETGPARFDAPNLAPTNADAPASLAASAQEDSAGDGGLENGTPADGTAATQPTRPFPAPLAPILHTEQGNSQADRATVRRVAQAVARLGNEAAGHASSGEAGAPPTIRPFAPEPWPGPTHPPKPRPRLRDEEDDAGAGPAPEGGFA